MKIQLFSLATAMALIILAPYCFSEEQLSLKLASWNLEYFTDENFISLSPSTLPRNNSERLEYKSMLFAINADVVAIQEVASKESLEIFSEKYESFFDETKGYTIKNAILYKRDLKDRVFSSFVVTDSVITTEDERKGIKKTRPFIGIRLNLTKKVTVLNVHIKHSCRSEKFNGDGCNTTIKQLEKLKKFIHKELESNVADIVLVVGDFNLRFQKTLSDSRKNQWDAFYNKMMLDSIKIQYWPKLIYPKCRDNKGLIREEFVDYFLCLSKEDTTCSGKQFLEYTYRKKALDWSLQMSDHCPISLFIAVGVGVGSQ
ncbi:MULTISPECIES: hypothetical protein [Vibrio harveyi group]|uniref:hypothetical protein n=1 Tax=Vibrio harveyi group TaxID=717610 RepID=UPI0038CD504F